MSKVSLQKARSITALKTPWTSKGRPDLNYLRENIQFQIDSGTHGIVLAGTTGEGHYCSIQDQRNIADFAVKHFGDQILLIGNASSNHTRESMRIARDAAEVGLDSVLATASYYGNVTFDDNLEHLRDIASVIDVIAYNVPGRVHFDMEPAFIHQAFKIDGIVAVKECVVDRIKPYIDRGYTVFSGNDATALQDAQAGAGIISVVSNVCPQEMSEIMTNPDSAKETWERLVPLIDALGIEPNPKTINTLMVMLGMVQANFIKPNSPAQPETREAIADAWKVLRGEQEVVPPLENYTLLTEYVE